MAGREPNSQPLERTVCRRRRKGARLIESTLRQLSAKTNIRPLITRAHCCCRRCFCWLFNEGNITCSACWETFTTTSSLAYEVSWPKLRRFRFIESNGFDFISWILFRSSKIDRYIPAGCYNNQTLKLSRLFYSRF